MSFSNCFFYYAIIFVYYLKYFNIRILTSSYLYCTNFSIVGESNYTRTPLMLRQKLNSKMGPGKFEADTLMKDVRDVPS